MTSPASRAANRPWHPRWDQHAGLRWSLAILSFFCAVIHFAVAGAHFQEWWLFGVLMLVAAWGQSVFGLGAILRPSRALWVLGAAFNLGIAVYYLVTRTFGDVIGPTPVGAESVGFGDLACTIAELLVVLCCGWLLRRSERRSVSLRQALRLPIVTAVVIVAVLSLSLVDGGPEMVMTAPGAGSSMVGMGSATGSTVHLATTSPAGAITMPDPQMQMAPGMKMANPAPCTAQPTGGQEQAAVALVDQSWAADQKYQNLATARAAGYVPLTRTGAPVVHYIDPTAYRATLAGGPVLDPAQPQSLVYANTPNGAVLVAAMYLTAPGGSGPTPGGCLTQWHEHTNLCFKSGGFAVVGALSARHPTCPAGSVNRTTQPMLHVWFVPLTGGPLAIDGSDQAIVSAAEQVASPANGTA